MYSSTWSGKAYAPQRKMDPATQLLSTYSTRWPESIKNRSSWRRVDAQLTRWQWQAKLDTGPELLCPGSRRSRSWSRFLAWRSARWCRWPIVHTTRRTASRNRGRFHSDDKLCNNCQSFTCYDVTHAVAGKEQSSKDNQSQWRSCLSLTDSRWRGFFRRCTRIAFSLWKYPTVICV